MATRAVRTPGVPVESAAPEADAVAVVEQAQEDLPNAIDVDARIIKGPVMTRQGWVIPDEAWQKDNRDELARLRQAAGV